MAADEPRLVSSRRGTEISYWRGQDPEPVQPAILQACRESRREGLKSYMCRSMMPRPYPVLLPVYVNPEKRISFSFRNPICRYAILRGSLMPLPITWFCIVPWKSGYSSLSVLVDGELGPSAPRPQRDLHSDWWPKGFELPRCKC
jgi:hypothetical protein